MKHTYCKIEPTSPSGWYKITSKLTGACLDNVKGYSAALTRYRDINKREAERAQAAYAKRRPR